MILNLVRAISIYVSVPIAFAFYGLNGALLAIALREAAVMPLIFWFNAKHGLNNFRFEALWLLFWPVGWVLGQGILVAHQWLVASA